MVRRVQVDGHAVSQSARPLAFRARFSTRPRRALARARAGRPGAAEARPSAGPQAPPDVLVFLERVRAAGSRAAGAGPRPARAGPVRLRRASAQHRARVGAGGKKTAVSAGAAASHPRALPTRRWRATRTCAADRRRGRPGQPLGAGPAPARGPGGVDHDLGRRARRRGRRRQPPQRWRAGSPMRTRPVSSASWPRWSPYCC